MYCRARANHACASGTPALTSPCQPCTMPGHGSSVTSTPARAAAAGQRDHSRAQRVELPHRQVQRRQARQVGVGRGDPRVVERHRPGDVLPAPVAHPLGREERVVAVARPAPATERSNQPEIDTKHAAVGSPSSRAASSVPSPSRPPQESPLTTTRPGSASPDTSAAVGGQAVLVRGRERCARAPGGSPPSPPGPRAARRAWPRRSGSRRAGTTRGRRRGSGRRPARAAARRVSSYHAHRTPPSTVSVTVTCAGTGWPWNGAIMARTAR